MVILGEEKLKGQVKNNEANVLQNGPKSYISDTFLHHFSDKGHNGPIKIAHKFPECNIFELPHYF